MWTFNANDFSIWSYRRQTYLILRKRLYEKSFINLYEDTQKYNWFWKEKNVTVNKIRTKITSRSKSMLYFLKKILKKSLLQIKIIGKWEIIAITQVNIEAQHIVYVIWDLMCLMKLLQFFTKSQTMIIILW